MNPSTTTVCLRADLHTPHPDGYVAYQVWARRMAQTHRQKKCPACGLWKVWEPR